MTPDRDPAGWYPDPYRQDVERYWTGEGWGPASRPRVHDAVRRAPSSSGPAASTGAGFRATAGGAGTDEVPGEPRRARGWAVLSVVAGVVMVAGSFLPWATVSGTFGQHASLSGTTGGDGWISVAFGVVIVLAGAISVPRPQRLATVAVDLGALAASVLTIYEFVHITSQSGVLSANNAVGIYDIGIGAGLGLVAVAAVVSLISAAGITGRDARSTLTD